MDVTLLRCLSCQERLASTMEVIHTHRESQPKSLDLEGINLLISKPADRSTVMCEVPMT